MCVMWTGGRDKEVATRVSDEEAGGGGWVYEEGRALRLSTHVDHRREDLLEVCT